MWACGRDVGSGGSCTVGKKMGRVAPLQETEVGPQLNVLRGRVFPRMALWTPIRDPVSPLDLLTQRNES